MRVRYIFDLSNFTLLSPSHPCQFLHLTTNLFPTFLPFDFVCNQLFLKKKPRAWLHLSLVGSTVGEDSDSLAQVPTNSQ